MRKEKKGREEEGIILRIRKSPLKKQHVITYKMKSGKERKHYYAWGDDT